MLCLYTAGKHLGMSENRQYVKSNGSGIDNTDRGIRNTGHTSRLNLVGSKWNMMCEVHKNESYCVKLSNPQKL